MLLSVTFVTLPGVAQLRGSNVTPNDLTPVGFSIIGPDDPAYDAALRSLGFSNNPDRLAIRSFSAILKNTSSRSVVAFAINWTFVDAFGSTQSRGFSFVQPSGLLDGGKTKPDRAAVEHQVRSGASRLVTANGMARNAEELHDLASRPFDGTVKSVTVDLAIFDDGETVGPNLLGLMEQFAAFVNAEQDLMQEVALRTSKGETVQQILTDIRDRLGPDTGNVPTTPAAFYEHNLRSYLKELEATNKHAGEMAVRNIVAYRKFDVRPNIHRPVSSIDTEVK